MRVQIFSVVWLIATLACGETPASAPTGPLSLVVLHSADTHAQLFPYARVLSARDEQRGLGSAETLTEVGGFVKMIGCSRGRTGGRVGARHLPDVLQIVAFHGENVLSGPKRCHEIDLI